MAATLRIGIVAGEASGDILGAGLIKSIKSLHPNAEFEGIGGPLMIAEGFNTLFPMERLSVMGFIEPFKRLPELLGMRKTVRQHFIANPPDLFLGIDSPSFNLDLEMALRKKAILTAHYVSPQIWAWRQGRVKKIAKAVDHMLTLFPFEQEIYQKNNIPVTFVGHPLADQFPINPEVISSNKCDARKRLEYHSDDILIALMPGSRGSEVKRLGEIFIACAQWCLQHNPELKFIIPAASSQRKKQLSDMLALKAVDLPIQLIDGQSHDAMMAADIVLMASGTTTLEALLLRRPMVVAYRMSAFSYALISRMLKTPFISLPNVLAGEALVPEILQENVQPQVLGELLIELLEKEEVRQKLMDRFTDIHLQLRKNASERAAQVLLSMIGESNEKD